MSDGKIITPTVGRIVWFTPGPDFRGKWHNVSQPEHRKPLVAMICHVWSDRMVNLDVVDSAGLHWDVTSVDLIQPDENEDAYKALGRYCTWMPYQVGQAAKTDDVVGQLKAQLGQLKAEIVELRGMIFGIMNRERVYAATPTTGDPGHIRSPRDSGGSHNEMA